MQLEDGRWHVPLVVQDDGWFVVPLSDEAARRDPDVVIVRRNGDWVKWIIDVHTPGLPPNVYRLGDLRLECRVYLAIEWGAWHGRLVMGESQSPPFNDPPMDALCGASSIFPNTRPWPRLQAYVIREGGRTKRYVMNGFRIAVRKFQMPLNVKEEWPAWSDEAQVEFVFADASQSN